jgi:hypothetical protein
MAWCLLKYRDVIYRVKANGWIFRKREEEILEFVILKPERKVPVGSYIDA